MRQERYRWVFINFLLVPERIPSLFVDMTARMAFDYLLSGFTSKNALSVLASNYRLSIYVETVYEMGMAGHFVDPWPPYPALPPG